MQSSKSIQAPPSNVKSRRALVAARVHRHPLSANVNDVSPERETFLFPENRRNFWRTVEPTMFAAEIENVVVVVEQTLLSIKNKPQVTNKCLFLCSIFRYQCSYGPKNLECWVSLICSVRDFVILRFPICCLCFFYILPFPQQTTECVWTIKYFKFLIA
jgi:hypothetical protein